MLHIVCFDLATYLPEHGYQVERNPSVELYHRVIATSVALEEGVKFEITVAAGRYLPVGGTTISGTFFQVPTYVLQSFGHRKMHDPPQSFIRSTRPNADDLTNLGSKKNFLLSETNQCPRRRYP